MLLFKILVLVAGSSVALAKPLDQKRSYYTSTVTIPRAYPTTAFKSYYPGFEATQTTAQVQPVVSDSITGRIYELNLTNSQSVPGNDTVDIVQWPVPKNKNLSLTAAYGIRAISAIVANNSTSSCTRCIDSLKLAQTVAQANPWEIEDLAIGLCIQYAFASPASCRNMYSRWTYAPILAQLLTFADIENDGQLICYNFISKAACPYPAAAPLDLSKYLTPKPTNLTTVKPSGKLLKVLHTSDWHLDPRYLTHSEASCSSGLCCRKGGYNSASPNMTVFPAPTFGAYSCDSPMALVMAALQSVPELTGTSKNDPFAFSILTGDVVSHDSANTLSRSYVEYTEVAMYGLVKKFLNAGPVYAAIGNHDQFQQAQDAPHAIQPGTPIEEMLLSWNYEHLAALWEHEGWISEDVAKNSVAHYGAYATTNYLGLKIITLNTDLWYKANYYAYINSTNPDTSEMLRFLIDELQKAEDAGQRVWIVGHVLPGWDGSNGLNNPTNLYYQIVDRYSHTIAASFFGHTHEDQFNIFYANNGTVKSEATAQNVAWICPSIVPLTNLNSGFRAYEIDSATFEIMEAHTWFTNVSTFTALDKANEGPVFQYEYSTRTAYDPNNTWPSTAPLNATFFHRITENFLAQPSLMELFTTHQGKSSAKTPGIQTCNTTACLEAKVCYMRSGSVALGKSCPSGYGSVQS